MKNALESITSPVLLQSATPEIIRAVQTRLGVSVDGICGAETKLAFCAFKKANNLGEPDYLGPTTAKKLLEKGHCTPNVVLALAASTIGYKESPPGSNKSRFGQWYGMDNQPWCASFVSWAFYQSGLPLPATTPKGFCYCPHGVRWFKKQGRFYKKPEVGDVCFFDWQGDSESDHVGIVEKVNGDGTVTTIEGNTSFDNSGSQSNGGCVARRIRSLKVIQGFGRPNWN